MTWYIYIYVHKNLKYNKFITILIILFQKKNIDKKEISIKLVILHTKFNNMIYLIYKVNLNNLK